MMDANQIESAQRACLKQCFGGALDAQESQQLRCYLATAEGQLYQKEVRKMQHHLHDIADVRITTPVDSHAMITKFEAMARDELRQTRRMLPVYFALTSGLSLLTGGLCLLSGKPDLRFFGWMMLAWAAGFAVLFYALGRQQTARLRGDNLLRSMDDDRALGSSPRVILIGSIIALIVLVTLSVALWPISGATGVATAWLGIGFCVYVSHVTEQRRRRENQELWDWWDGREA